MLCFYIPPKCKNIGKQNKSGLEDEGLSDIAGRIVSDEAGTDTGGLKERDTYYRLGFKKYEGKIYLPKFVIQEKESWRDLNFDVDILSGIDWENINIDEIKNIALQNKRSKEQEIILGLSEEVQEVLKETGRAEKTGTLEIDEVFLTRQISEIIPNPWYCFNIGEKALKLVSDNYDQKNGSNQFRFYY